MSIAVPSRFACLKIEDDDPPRGSKAGNRSSKKNSSTLVPKNVPSATKKGATKQNGTVPKKPKDKKRASEKQWEDWKKRDTETLKDSFEQDLESAIIQSKLDYERHKGNTKKEVHDANKKDSNIKKKKTKTMSLEQFLGGGDKKSTEDEATSSNPDFDEKYLEKLLETTKKEVNRGKAEEERKEREANIEDVITLAHVEERLEKERAINNGLKSEISVLKDEILDVKARNKTLCSILAQGEMKDKAAVLLELERLASDKNELTEEVTRLHSLLEQERSKVAILKADKYKDKSKK